jgi:IS4 transposase
VRHRSLALEAESGVRSDQLGRLKSFYPRKAYPEKIRVIHFYDEVQDRRLCFLTNHLQLPASTICQLYKMRWQVELFFKWIKQNLRIKRFYGTSVNAVKTQVWIAVCVYVLVAIAKKQLGASQSLHRILQNLSVSVFQKTPLDELLTNLDPENETDDSSNQLLLFDL